MRPTALASLGAAAFAAVLFAATPAAAQRKGADAGGAGQGDFKKIDLTEPDWKGADYTLFTPKGLAPGRTYPLVFALHGNGHKSDAHVKNMARVSTSAQPCFVVAPQYQQGYEFNNPCYPRTGELFKQILDTICAEQPIDRGRLILQGFSMGANYACGWTYGWYTKEPDAFPFCALWMNGTAVPPGSGQGGREAQKAPPIPYLLFVGEKETAVLGQINVVKSVRECYRIMHGLGCDVRYLEIPNMGHTVNETCLQHMRECVADLPNFAGADAPVRGLPDAGRAALTHAARGRLKDALATLEALRADGSTLDAGARGKVASQLTALEKWCKGYAASEPKRLAAAWSAAVYEAWLCVVADLAEHATLGKALATAAEKLQKHRAVQAELKARDEYRAAAALEDPAAARAAFEKLARGPLAATVYGGRAGEHLQALSDEYGPAK